jgi:hypothetical protein
MIGELSHRSFICSYVKILDIIACWKDMAFGIRHWHLLVWRKFAKCVLQANDMILSEFK